MNNLLGKLFLILSLVLFMQQTVYGVTIGSKFSTATASLQKKVVTAIVSLALLGGLGGAQQLAQAQQEVQEQEKVSPWTIVNADTPQFDYLHNVFNLHVTNIDEPETQYLFPTAYLGKSAQNEDIFIAFAEPAGIGLLEKVGENVDLSLINYRGEVWEGVSITGHAIAKDKLDGFFDLVILSFAGADLEIASPLQLGSYPYDDGGAMVRLASYQRRSYFPTLLEEEIAEIGAAGFQLGTRNDCRVIFNPKWSSVGVGLHTCSGVGETGLTGGAIALRQHKVVGMQNARVNDFALVRGISPYVSDIVASVLAGQTLPVEARGKLATMWGKLKIEQ